MVASTIKMVMARPMHENSKMLGSSQTVLVYRISPEDTVSVPIGMAFINMMDKKQAKIKRLFFMGHFMSKLLI